MAKDARLKSLFINPATVIAGALCAVSLVAMLFAGGHRLAWFGAALAGAPLPLIVLRLRLRPVARTSEYLPLHLLLLLAGVVLAGQGMYTNFVTSWELYQEFPGAVLSAFNPTPVTLPGLTALTCALLFLLYVFWYSPYGRHADARLDVGSKVPEFEVRDLDGSTVTSRDLLGAPTVFLFYRGNWCPLCMAQIEELAERHAEFERLGISVCLISPQPERQSRELARRHAAAFRFLVDTDNAAARSLGIVVSNGVPAGVRGGYAPDTVMPTLFVTTAGGTIVFSDQTDNYRVRPEPDIFLAILRRAEAPA